MKVIEGHVGMFIQVIDDYRQKFPGKLSEIIIGHGYGHITGIEFNSTNELIFSVKWVDGEESLMHPANVEPLKDTFYANTQ